MSEGIAFVGGISIAGLAALILLKGTVTPSQQPNFPVTPQVPTVESLPTVQQPLPYPPNYGQQPIADPNQALQLEQMQMQMEIEKLEADNQQLMLQNQQLQLQLESFTAQQQWNLAQQQNQQEVAALPAAGQNSQSESPIVWAVGGALLTVCGGVVTAVEFDDFELGSRRLKNSKVGDNGVYHIHARQWQFATL